MNKEVDIQSIFTDYMLEILISAIVLFLSISLILFVLTLAKRLMKIRKGTLKARYQKIIYRAIFNYLFSQKEINPEKTNIFNFDYSHNYLFHKVAIKAIVGLHHSYSGEYKEKLESFYVKSKFVNYSLRKLHSKKWYHKIEAIRDLSTLNYQPAFEKIKLCLGHKNKLVQSEAIIGILKLRGINELIEQISSKLYLNDWIQSNILFTIKSNRINDTGNLGKLLESENTSVQLLGVRLINHYNNADYLDKLTTLEAKTTDAKLKTEIGKTKDSINQYYNDSL